MGGAMAGRLLELGWQVQVCDIDAAKSPFWKKKGLLARATPAQAAMDSIALIVCVVDAAQTEAVLFGPDGAAAAMRPGQAVLLCPTIAPQDVEGFAQRLAERGIAAIDAPMSGGPARARDGSMSLMVACADEAFERCRALIEALSSKVFRISRRPGDGARTKLVNNLLAGINLAGAAEAIAMAQRMGLDTGAHAGCDRAVQRPELDRLGPHAPRHRRRLRAARPCDAAAEGHAPGGGGGAGRRLQGPLGPAARDVFARAAGRAWARLDDAALFKLLSSP